MAGSTGLDFTISTQYKSKISLSFYHQASATGPSAVYIAYSLNGSAGPFSEVVGNVTTYSNTGVCSSTPITAVFPQSVDCQSAVVVRVSGANAAAPAGAWRITGVTLSAAAGSINCVNNPVPCAPCAIGTYATVPSATSSLVCTACGSGMYSDQPAASACSRLSLSNALITTYLGDGTASSAGDGGSPADAKVSYPTGMAYDVASGSLYICDAWAHRVRQIRGGCVSTFAGSGPLGVGSGSSTGDGFAATLATLNIPNAVAVGPGGEVYILEHYGCKIRLVLNGAISTLAGSGTCSYADGAVLSAAFMYPKGLALKPNGDFYVAEEASKRLRLIRGGLVSTIYSAGEVNDVAINSLGDVFFSITNSGSFIAVNNCGVLRLRGAIISAVTVAGCSSSGDGGLASAATIDPKGIAIDRFDELNEPIALILCLLVGQFHSVFF